MDLEKELNAVTEYVRQNAGAEVVSTMEAATAALGASGLAERALGRGKRIPPFVLPDATGRMVRSGELLAAGPVVLCFYRGSWCPYCNLELKALQGRLSEIRAKGASLVGISPQTPDHSLDTQQKNALDFPVLSDTGNEVARRFGLVFKLAPSLEPIYKAFGVDLAKHNGDESLELPVPATYVIASDGTVVDAFIDVDYRRRLDPDVIVKWLDRARS